MTEQAQEACYFMVKLSPSQRKLLKQAHMVNLLIRKDGKEYLIPVDSIKQQLTQPEPRLHQ